VTGKSDIARMRLRNQGIADPRFTAPHAVVSWFGAMQAQDYLAALWAVGLRMKKAVEADIERALAEKKIVRSWPLRGTLHFVAAEDLKWMLELLAPRVIARNAARLKREFELNPSALRQCRKVLIPALQGGQLTRGEFYDALGRARIRTNASRGLHIIFALAHEGLICFGPRRAKQQTFVLLDEWAPESSTDLKGDAALHELARRYFASHSPATVADFTWWSGLPAVEAKRAAEMAGAHRKRKSATIPTPSAWLLPAFDEYLVGYKDRSAVIDPAYVKRVNAGGWILNPTIVVDGEVIGTWKRIMKRDGVAITRSLFRPLKKHEERVVSDAEERYANFVGVSRR
jgi:hypothetical protein